MVKFQGGSQQISELLVQRLGAENVHLNTPVEKIVQTDDGKKICFIFFQFIIFLFLSSRNSCSRH